MAVDERYVRRAQIALVGLLFALPHLVGLVASSGDYTPFSVGASVSALTFDETQLYLPGPTRFAFFGALPAEVDVRELGAFRNGYPILHSIVVGSLARLVGSVETAWMALHALLPALAWLLFYVCFRRFTDGPLLASAGSWIAILLPFGPRHSFLIGRLALVQPLELSRIPHPALSYTLLLATVVAWAAALRSPRPRAWALAGAATGISSYAYYFTWNSLCLGLAASFAIALALGQRRLARKLFVLGACAAAVAVPYYLRVLAGARDGHQQVLLARLGTFKHSSPVAWLVLGGALVVALAAFQRRVGGTLDEGPDEGGALTLALFAVLAGAGIGLNLQLVTGYEPQHAHYLNRILQPTGLALCYLGLLRFARGRARSALVAVSIALAVPLAFAATARQARSGWLTRADHQASGPSMELARWVRGAGLADQVLGTTEPELALLLPALTPNWNFVPVADRTMARDEEILARYLTLSAVQGVGRDEAIQRLARRSEDEERQWLGPEYVFFQGKPRYADLPTPEPASVLARCRLDYLVLPRASKVEPARRYFPALRLVHENAAWALYRLRE